MIYHQMYQVKLQNCAKIKPSHVLGNPNQVPPITNWMDNLYVRTFPSLQYYLEILINAPVIKEYGDYYL